MSIPSEQQRHAMKPTPSVLFLRAFFPYQVIRFVLINLRMTKMIWMSHRNPKENVMTHNEGSIDRGVRIALGLALLSLVFVGPHTWLGLIGLVPLLTGIFGFCPLYRVLGIRTCPTHS